MELKLFGKKLFEFNRNGGPVSLSAEEALIKSEYLPDFYTNSRHSSQFNDVVGVSSWGTTLSSDGSESPIKKVEPIKKAEKTKITPKRLHQLKALNDAGFELKSDPKYVDEQIESFKTKLTLYKDKEYDYRGSNEISSILIRLRNRKKYPAHKKFYDEFPYTTTEKIERLLEQHKHLKMGEVSVFLADMPREATDVMGKYTKETQKLSGKKSIFYIIANKKDFEKTQKRRDPILLAQSPFAHVWQILGAWDEEMLLIDEL